MLAFLVIMALQVADLDRIAQELENENMILKKRVSNLKLAKENKVLPVRAKIEAIEKNLGPLVTNKIRVAYAAVRDSSERVRYSSSKSPQSWSNRSKIP